jgi:hypothetical protein
MQIHRANQLYFPAASPQPSASDPASLAATLGDDAANTQPGVKTSSGQATKKASGVDLGSMTLEKQLEFGKDHGVFTKITISKEGLQAARADQERSAQATGFVSSAVTTLKDFEEGLALLNKDAAANTGSTPGNFFAAKFRGLQQAAGKLNVFA